MEGNMATARWLIVLSAILAAATARVSAAPPMTGAANSPGPAAGSMVPATIPAATAGIYEFRYRFDAQDAWIHGYTQQVPAYGGFNAFRPYNYKHVLLQSQIAAGWGMSPSTPYAQQLWPSQAQTAMRDSAAEYRTAGSEASGAVVPAAATVVPPDTIEPWPFGSKDAGQR
jgi:hypothetical protein